MSRHIHTSESKSTSVHELATGCIHTATLDHHHPQIVWTGASKCLFVNHLSSPPIMTIWLWWLCQCGDINVQAHPYIRVIVNISAWIGCWMHPYLNIGSSLVSFCASFRTLQKPLNMLRYTHLGSIIDLIYCCANVTSHYKLISVTLPMWWYQSKHIHTSESKSTSVYE